MKKPPGSVTLWGISAKRLDPRERHPGGARPSYSLPAPLQGDSAPLRLRHSARKLTDGAGLVLLRRLWDRWDLGSWLDRRAAEISGHYRPSLMVEVWTALLLYGDGWMDDLKLVAARGLRRIFGWEAVPDPTTFGRWLRRAGPTLVPLLDEPL